MRRRLKLLTVGLVLVTAAVAGCSSTTAGSAGAIQDDVELAPSAPASSSAGPTSSPDPVGPSPAPTEAPASPVASPTDSPSPSGSSAGPALLGAGRGGQDVCNAGLAYACGDLGESGVGTVFYASSSPFECGAELDGGNFESSCNYLEMAPNMWNPNSSSTCKVATGTSCGGSLQTTSDFSSTGLGFPWCTGSGGTGNVNGANMQYIGAGFANTTAMLPVCNPGDAGNVARSYTGGGLTDWSLPSLYELTALYNYNNRAAIGGFNSGLYWSSMEENKTNAYDWSFNPNDGGTYNAKSTSYGVRPVRAF